MEKTSKNKNFEKKWKDVQNDAVFDTIKWFSLLPRFLASARPNVKNEPRFLLAENTNSAQNITYQKFE